MNAIYTDCNFIGSDQKASENLKGLFAKCKMIMPFSVHRICGKGSHF